jgi:vancomycin resistance protein VanJ
MTPIMKQRLQRLSTYLTVLGQRGYRLGLTISYVFVAIVLAWNVLKLYPGDRWTLVRLGSYMAPWLCMGLLPAFAIVLLSRRRLLIAFALVAAVSMAGRFWYLFTPQPAAVSAEAGSAHQLRVMTFNVHYANHDAQAIAILIDTEAPDVIAIQELVDEHARLLQPRLASAYPYQLLNAAAGLALISRYPLKNQPLPLSVGRVQHALIELPEGEISMWNLHPRPTLKPGRWALQKETMAAVAQALEAETRPTIVLGDFNTTDQEENYQLIAGHLRDVQQAVGQGFGFTFPEPNALHRMISLPWPARSLIVTKPIIRIDHILVSNHFIPQEIHVVPDAAGSDHRPVVATLQYW